MGGGDAEIGEACGAETGDPRREVSGGNSQSLARPAGTRTEAGAPAGSVRRTVSLCRIVRSSGRGVAGTPWRGYPAEAARSKRSGHQASEVERKNTPPKKPTEDEER